MNQFYYYNKLLEQSDRWDRELLDLLKFDLDKKIYYYGQNFSTPIENNINKNNNLLKHIKTIIKNNLRIVKYIITPKMHKNMNKNIISNAYFTVNSEIAKLGFNVISPPWHGYQKFLLLHLYSFYDNSMKIFHRINDLTFFELLSDPFKKELEDYFRISKEIYNEHFDALVVPFDMPAIEKIAIKTFKEINKPSFVFLHGLPGRYNNVDDNRADYLIVWGEMIKNHYINHGVPPDKIFVSGHPYYKTLQKNELKFSFDNLLILTCPTSGIQHSDYPVSNDRNNSIYYLYSIQSVLQRLGVKSVRLRTHPSENGNWYLKYIDNNFFNLDKDNLVDSLKNTSLVIGPSSTLLMESIYYSVNYIVYNPEFNYINLSGRKSAPPFDGSDSRLPVAKDEESLYKILKDKIMIDSSLWNDYIKTPFDISFIKELI